MGGGGGRSPCCDKSKVKKGPWSPAEDVRLVSFIQKHGHPNWRSLPKQAGLLRCGKSCRLRWINYLRPDVKRGNFTPQEEDSIIRLHATFGNKWSKIASKLPGRTDNEIKNVWNTHLKKRSSFLITSPSSSVPSSYNDISSGIIHEQQIVNQNIMTNQEIYGHEPSTATSCNNNDSTGDHEANDQLNDNNNVVPLLESEVDQFWNMLDDIQLHDDENGSPMEIDRWLRLLEEELGLSVPPTTSI